MKAKWRVVSGLVFFAIAQIAAWSTAAAYYSNSDCYGESIDIDLANSADGERVHLAIPLAVLPSASLLSPAAVGSSSEQDCEPEPLLADDVYFSVNSAGADSLNLVGAGRAVRRVKLMYAEMPKDWPLPVMFPTESPISREEFGDFSKTGSASVGLGTYLSLGSLVTPDGKPLQVNCAGGWGDDAECQVEYHLGPNYYLIYWFFLSKAPPSTWAELDDSIRTSMTSLIRR